MPGNLKKLMPAQAKIKNHFCGGVVLNERYVLTSGMCASAGVALPGILAIEFGSNDLVKAYDEDKYVLNEKLIFHPDWQVLWPTGATDDIGGWPIFI